MTRHVRVAHIDELLPAERAAVSALCASAFGEPWDAALLRISRTPRDLDLDGPMAVEARSVEPWWDSRVFRTLPSDA